MTGGEAVVRALEAHGVDMAFGIPGTHSLPIYRHLHGSRIRHIMPRHEQGAGFAADGYARASGRPGVCLVTTGPGVTNVATAAAQAYSDSIPMLIISPGVPGDVYKRNSGYVHEAKDLSGAMDNLVAWSHRATSPTDVVDSIYRAFWEFASSRPRPIHLEVPLEVLDMEEAVTIGARRDPSPPEASDASIRQAREILAGAKRVGLLVGGGAQGAAVEIGQLAQTLDAIVVTSANGKGVFPENHPLAVGAALPNAAGREALGSCDVVVAIATEISQSDVGSAKLVVRGKVVRIDIDADQRNKNLNADCFIHGDALDAIRRLLIGLDQRTLDGAARARDARAKLADEVAAESPEMLETVKAIQRSIADDTIVVCDTAMLSWNGIFPLLQVKTPRSCFYPTGYATLGYALPAGIGAKLAQPHRTVVVVIGDGGVMFTIAELATCVEQGLQLAIVITNNRGYGEIRKGMLAGGIEPIGVTFDAPDFVKLAEAFGARGVRTADAAELEDELGAAFRNSGPTVIEVAM